MKRVAVLGGGVAGLTAAHELCERGFSVTVYEKSAVLGGKARSFRTILEPRSALGPFLSTDESIKHEAADIERALDGLSRANLIDRQLTEGRSSVAHHVLSPAAIAHLDAAKLSHCHLPGEHGFRLIPAFYKHLPDTMSRIPSDVASWQRRTVADNLVPGTRVLVARESGALPLDLPLRFRTIAELSGFLKTGIPSSEIPTVLAKLAALVSASETRWDTEYESKTWWDFIEANQKSDAYQKYLGEIGVRWFAAMDPHQASARTIGKIGLQLWKDFIFGVVSGAPPKETLDHFLNGPTSEVWFEPWERYLASQGVSFEVLHTVLEISCDGEGRVNGMVVDSPAGKRRVNHADYYVATLPIGAMHDLLQRSPQLKRADPAFSKLSLLRSCEGWMVGLQFYLKNDVPITPGGLIFADAPWALTGVSQSQFWKPQYRSMLMGKAHGVLSVIISDWNTPGDFLRKPANACTPQELKIEVWNEIKAHLNQRGTRYPRDEDVISDGELLGWQCSIPYDQGSACWQNDEKLLLNKVGSWANRPEAVTHVRNFFLAADYVRTHTDLATMEGANEAARRAVNGILDEERSSEARCQVWPLDLELPLPFQALRKVASAADLLQLRGNELLSNMRSLFARK